MDTILQNGIAFTLAFQALGTWLTAPMRFFTFLGSQEFLLLILPVVYWCVNANVGVRVGVVLLITGGLNDVLKLAFHGPRPYWVSTDVKALAFEPSFGAPSGHAQVSVAIWGLMAASIKRPWAWAVAIGLIVIVGLSRIYLGVHFLHDVLLGWLIGALVLWGFLHWADALTLWLKSKSLRMQIGLAFGASALMFLASSLTFLALQGWVLPVTWVENALKAGAAEAPNPVSISNATSSAGAMFGLLAGFAWMMSRGGFSAAGPVRLRVARFLLGVLGLLIIWYGLGQIFPRDDSLIASLLRYLRYALVGGWISAGAPLFFLRLRLAAQLHAA